MLTFFRWNCWRWWLGNNRCYACITNCWWIGNCRVRKRRWASAIWRAVGLRRFNAVTAHLSVNTHTQHKHTYCIWKSSHSTKTSSRYWPVNISVLPFLTNVGPCCNIAMLFGTEKLEWCDYRRWYIYLFWQNPRTWQMDRRTNRHRTMAKTALALCCM